MRIYNGGGQQRIELEDEHPGEFRRTSGQVLSSLPARVHKQIIPSTERSPLEATCSSILDIGRSVEGDDEKRWSF
jgi:hypothetical protein